MKQWLLGLAGVGVLAACQQSGVTPLMKAVSSATPEDVFYAPLVQPKQPVLYVSELIKDTPLKELLRSGVDVNARDDAGRTALFYIDSKAQRNAEQAVRLARLLVQHGADVNARDQEGNTPILSLAGIGDFYYEDEGETDTALHLLQYYVSAGADVFARNDAGYNALDLALGTRHFYSGNARMVQQLKKLGLKSTPDRELVWCADRGDVAGVRRLLAAGANPDACSVEGVPALIAAMVTPVECERPETLVIMELLLRAGAAPNAKDHEKRCALEYSRWNTMASTLLLLRYGASAKSLEVTDYTGGHDEYVNLMRKNGAIIKKDD